MNQLAPGSILNPSGSNSFITSPSGHFAFGFRSLPSNSSCFVLAIWFNLASPQTIVWFATDSTNSTGMRNPVLATKSSTLRLVLSGSLSLTDPLGKEVWNPGPTNATKAILLDSGNLILYDGNNNFLWQSFDIPTDTLLPTQSLAQGSMLLIVAQILDGCSKTTDYGSGMCGFNAYCNADTSQEQLHCECPPHYSFLDPQYKYKGCKPDFTLQSCIPGQTDEFDFVELANTNWSDGDYDHYTSVMDVENWIHRMLIYEYMSHGSLTNYLFGESKPSWSKRVQIAISIARGIRYLHEECDAQIIHRDIKPHNILLDQNIVPKISDFGLAKLLYADRTQTTTCIRGTKGYVAPEWFRNTPITAKVDVYSFGVMLLEIICCRRNMEWNTTEEIAEVLIYWASDCVRNGRINQLVEGDDQALADMTTVERFVWVAILCVQEEPSQRPSMHVVSPMLEGMVRVYE
ncbi:hypothetical protein LUZ60_004645 [Juncus effusus]|nr:hypothetical protein LUZ60_004645 [Juncus effusus]